MTEYLERNVQRKKSQQERKLKREKREKEKIDKKKAKKKREKIGSGKRRQGDPNHWESGKVGQGGPNRWESEKGRKAQNIIVGGKSSLKKE